MGLNVGQFRLYVVRPTLEKLDMYSPAAENLLLGTAAQESGGFEYIHQLGDGPAHGLYQMEPATFNDIFTNYLAYKEEDYALVMSFAASTPEPVDQLVTNMAFATVMTRIHYRRVRESLPSADDVRGMGDYWKKYYNTELGKGTSDEFVKHYNMYVTN